MKSMLKYYLTAAADLIMPRTCVVCGTRLNVHESHLCLPCMADMPFTHYWEESRNPMADKFNDLLRSHDPMERKYVFAAALFFFSSDAGYRQIPYQLKYHGREDIGRHFGRMLGRKLAGALFFRNVDMVVPVPLHWTRRWSRGYNQAETIAREVAAALDVTLRTDLLERTRRSRSQTTMEIGQKAGNVKGVFRVREETVMTFERRAREKPAHILIIDDVFTTGSTLHACFCALRQAFPPSVRISIATLGFVGGA